MRKCTLPVIVANCDRAVDSPDVSDRAGDITWDNQMIGNNSRWPLIRANSEAEPLHHASLLEGARDSVRGP